MAQKSLYPRNSILRKIHSMRSTLYLRKPKNMDTVSLRRMKTFASLSSRYYQMDSLKGRSIEALAQLGGYSFLMLPADFAPTPLKLPACIVATASYLRFHGSHPLLFSRYSNQKFFFFSLASDYPLTDSCVTSSKDPPRLLRFWGSKSSCPDV